MAITVDLTNCTLMNSNETYNFYLTPKIGYYYYCYAVIKGTSKRTTMAGFSQKKCAIRCINAWVGWMR